MSNGRERAILVVDDEDTIRGLIVEILRDAGWKVEEAENGLRAMERLATQSFALIFTDNKMPGLLGISMVRRLREKGDRTPAILITGQATIPGVVRSAMQAGVDMILSKPVDMNGIIRAAERFLSAPMGV